MKTGIIPALVGIFGMAVAANCPAATWTVKTVDGTDGGGFDCALVLNPTSGKPAMSYFRPSTSMGFYDLYYATPSGSGWLKEPVYTGTSTPGTATSIVLTELGTPAISYTHSNFVNYKIRTGGSWGSEVTVPGNGGPFSSMLWGGTEAAPTPLIAYQDATLGYLKTALFNGATFNAATQDNGGNVGGSESLAEYAGYSAIAYIKAGKLGCYDKFTAGGQTFAAVSANAFTPFSAGFPAQACAVAVAPSQASGNPADIRPHVILFNANGYYYTTTDTNDARWMTPELIETVGSQLQTFQGCSIAVGSDGVVRVAYFDFANRQLRYAERKNGTWTSELVSSALGGANCMLRLDSRNLPHIAYTAIKFDGANYNPSGLVYAELASSSSTSGSGGPPTLQILGKKKVSTTNSKVLVKGTASSGAVAIQWRIGKKAFKKVSVNGGSWKVKVKPLPVGKTKVSFRAISASGQTSGLERVVIKRGS